MATQLSTAVRNARLDQIETTIGASAVVKIRSGAPPANCAVADSGTVLATFNLASDWAGAASGGSKSFSGTPIQDASADNTGTAGHFRLYAADGTTCHMQGSVSVTGGGGDMEIDNTSINAGQTVQITSWTLTDGNA